MRSVQWNQIGLSVVCACMLSLGLMNPGLVLAGQPKIDVCHSEGNGSYHLINIAAPAYPSHVAHGDGGIGESVPGHEGFVFDEDCNLVTAAVCPCDFSAENFLALDGNACFATLEIVSPTEANLHNPLVVEFSVNEMSCLITSGDGMTEIATNTSEAEACVIELQATADALSNMCP